MRKLVSDTGQLADGTQVAGWYPSYDGGEVTFEVAESSLRSRSLDLPRQVDGISMNFKFGITNTPTAPRIDNTPGWRVVRSCRIRKLRAPPDSR